MPVERLGKIHLHWCDGCNLPLVEEGKCGICSEEGRKVEITPPGDVRPAFQHDIGLIREVIDAQWGEDYSYEIIPKEKVVLLNGAPALDRMDEVIVDGRVVGTLKYNLKRKMEGKEPYQFILRPWKGLSLPDENYMIMDGGAVEPILDGASALAPGILRGDEGVREGEEVMIFSEEGDLLASGKAEKDGGVMIENDSGKGVKNRWRVDDFVVERKEQNWDSVIKANRELMEKRIESAKDFVREKVEENDLPPAVSYSGGKDSLATLLLVLESGIEPDLLFVDTGIEFPETVKNVRNTAEKYDLELKERKAEGGFWDSVEHFGPSARDYRWCCKTCKLGPTSRMIIEEYPVGVLSFIGQRRYESRQRMMKGSTWKNPWVPGQFGASPIQDWTAFHVWLLLFMKDADWNPKYEEGFERIGCWLCPASDLAELKRVEEGLPEFERFKKLLVDYMEREDLPEEWLELGLWRWVDIPKEMERYLEGSHGAIERELERDKITIELPSKEKMMEDDQVRDLLPIIGAESEESLSGDELRPLYLKAAYCVECDVCIGKCPEEALYFDNGIRLDEESCVQCGECLQECPVIEFTSRVGSDPG